eukprot:1017861-Ditylum_brightwellii.AAC.1
MPLPRRRIPYQVVSRTTVQHTTEAEIKADEIREQSIALDEKINECLSSTNFVQHGLSDMLYEEDIDEEVSDINESIDNPLPIEPDALVGNLEESTDTFDEYLGAELVLDPGPERTSRRGTVVKREKGEDGRPI